MVHQSATSTCRDKPMAAAITDTAPYLARDRDLHNRALLRG
ncbi:MAG: heme A synthase, partial [Mesorhizobium sp.]